MTRVAISTNVPTFNPDTYTPRIGDYVEDVDGEIYIFTRDHIWTCVFCESVTRQGSVYTRDAVTPVRLFKSVTLNLE